MKKLFETDEHGIVSEFPYHDAVLESLLFFDDQLTLKIKKNEGTTKIELSNVHFVQVTELIPKGIVLSCYSFPMGMCPSHLQGHLDFDKARQFVDDENISVFYVDGSMGFELLVCHGGGKVVVDH